MRKQNYTNTPYYKGLSRLIVGILFTFCCSNPFAFGQTLFETAVTLDSLFTASKGDSTSAKKFFTELEKIYHLEETISPSDIKLDFAGNRYMSRMVNTELTILTRVDDQIKDKIQELEDKKRSFFTLAVQKAENACKPKARELPSAQLNLLNQSNDSTSTRPMASLATTRPEDNKPCNIDKELRTLLRDTTFENLTALRKKTTDETLEKELIELEGSIIKLDFEINEQKAGSESVFQLRDNSASGLLVDQSNTISTAALSPVIVQQGGSGSIQSSIIDGTSKWIAERMREELSIAFFDRFEYWVEGQNIKILFPNTFSALKSSVTTDYALMTQIFKTAFEKDLKHLPFYLGDFLEEELAYRDTLKNMEDNIVSTITDLSRKQREIKNIDDEYNQLVEEIIQQQEQVVESPNIDDSYSKTQQTTYYDYYDQNESYLDQLINERYILANQIDTLLSKQEKIDTKVEESFKILKYVLFTLKAIHLLSEGEHPTTLLSYLNENIDELFPQSGNVKPSLLIMDVISRSLISINAKKGTVWLKGKDLSKLKNSAQLRDFYFGLIYQEITQTIRKQRNRIENKKKTIINQAINESYEIQEIIFNIQYPIEKVNELLYDYSSYDYDPSFKSLDVFLSDMTDYGIFTEEEAKRYQVETSNLFDSATNTDIIYNSDETLINRFINLYDSIYQLPAITDLFDKDPNFSIINENDLYFPESPAAQSILSQINMRKLSIQAVDSILDASKTSLQSFIKFNLPIDHALTDQFKNISGELLIGNLKAFYRSEHAFIFRDSITNITSKYIIRSARRDSIKQVNLIINESDKIQRLYLQTQRLNRDTTFINQLLLKDNRSFGDIVNGFLQFATRMDNIHAEFKELKNKKDNYFGTQEFIYLMKNSLDALNQVYEMALPGNDGTLQTVQGLTTNLLDAYSAVLEHNYDAVVMNIMPVADSLLELSYRNKTRELRRIATQNDTVQQSKIVSKILEGKLDLSTKTKKELKEELKPAERKDLRKAFKKTILGEEKNYARIQLEKYLEQKENKVRKMHEIFKYGAFLAAVVESKDADEIKKAIQAVALPAGSYSIKRRTYRNISLNSYPGLTGGLEIASADGINSRGSNFGFTAPIGLAVSWGYKTRIDGYKYYTKRNYRKRVEKSDILDGNRFLSGHSGTLYFPLIDLGAVVLIRFEGNESSLPEDIGFQQIFSPGIMYSHGLPDLPISIMGGAQISPQLRTINDVQANSLRFNLSLVVDLPMANFHTKTSRQ